MSPATHFLLSWLTANTTDIDSRDRMIITIAGISPDIDGLVIIADLLTRNSDYPLQWWGKYHHVLAHNIGFALFAALVSLVIAKRKCVTAFLVLAVLHLHFVCDLLGSRGPDGYQWPTPYFFPFSEKWQWAWEGQWALNAWPNFVITGAAICMVLFLAWNRGYSPLEMVSAKADSTLVSTLRNRFGTPGADRL